MYKNKQNPNSQRENAKITKAVDTEANSAKLNKKEAAQPQATNSAIPEMAPRCICNRKPKTLVCIHCKMFTYGRIAQKCLEHLNVTFLMDFICCPNCLAPKHFMRGVDVDHSLYQDINANTSFGATHNMSFEGAADAYHSLKLQNS